MSDLTQQRDHCRAQAEANRRLNAALPPPDERSSEDTILAAQRARETVLWDQLADEIDDYLAGRLGTTDPADDHEPLFGPVPTEVP